MNVDEFIGKWVRAELKERSGAQEHFLDLCDLLDHPRPAAADPAGEWFTFEKGVAKHDEDAGDTPQPETRGWADVWKKGFFAWEYKGNHKDLSAAYDQLLQYREDLENPPLLVVSDMQRIIIRTNFTSTPTKKYDIPLAALAREESLRVLRALFHDPEALRPGTTSEAITARAAAEFAEIAQSMRTRGLDPQQVARFLDRVVFCLFAEDVGILPQDVFTELIQRTRRVPSQFVLLTRTLFQAMAVGGYYVYDKLRHFNGNLFSDASVLEPTVEELERVYAAAQLDWGAVSPSIFGTLFERGLDPAKRAQLGAHYTDEAAISALVEPVVMQPLRRDWCEVRSLVEALLTTGRKRPTDRGPRATKTRARGEAGVMVHSFLTRLASVKVLDPACGSGNFLYVALRKLKDLEKEVVRFAEARGLGSFLPLVGPWQLYGIEVNPYAFDLAQMSVWIGYLQWTRANGFQINQDPVLKPMEGNFRCQDAILDLSDPATPKEPEWPRVDCVVGNPPFLGDKLMRRELGDAYVDKLRGFYADRIPGQSDLCCYWFEKARSHLAAHGCKRVGLLATQGIRGRANRTVLERIKATGSIFFAESDRPWVLDGANVHVSMIGFDDGSETERWLDGRESAPINTNLTTALDLTAARRLSENGGISSVGTTKKAPLDIDEATAVEILGMPNPHGRPNSDVIRPWLNGQQVTGRRARRWIIDYPLESTENAAALYERPFAHVVRHVKPLRYEHREAVQARFWWRLARPVPALAQAMVRVPRCLVTPEVSKHRIFVWVSCPVNVDHQLIVFVRSDDYFLGVLHSRVHELWALKQGTRLETRPRYTPTTCFETFPFPWPPGREPVGDPRHQAIGSAAHNLCELRNRWLNPPEWTTTEVLEFAATVGGPWDRYIVNPRAPSPPAAGGVHEVRETDTTAIEFALAERAVAAARARARETQPLRPGEVGVARYPRLVARDADSAKRLAKRTLTAVYNERPAWLADAHRRLDEAVCAAYGWPPTLADDEVLERLLDLNQARATPG